MIEHIFFLHEYSIIFYGSIRFSFQTPSVFQYPTKVHFKKMHIDGKYSKNVPKQGNGVSLKTNKMYIIRPCFLDKFQSLENSVAFD